MGCGEPHPGRLPEVHGLPQGGARRERPGCVRQPRRGGSRGGDRLHLQLPHRPAQGRRQGRRRLAEVDGTAHRQGAGPRRPRGGPRCASGRARPGARARAGAGLCARRGRGRARWPPGGRRRRAGRAPGGRHAVGAGDRPLAPRPGGRTRLGQGQGVGRPPAGQAQGEIRRMAQEPRPQSRAAPPGARAQEGRAAREGAGRDASRDRTHACQRDQRNSASRRPLAAEEALRLEVPSGEAGPEDPVVPSRRVAEPRANPRGRLLDDRPDAHNGTQLGRARVCRPREAVRAGGRTAIRAQAACREALPRRQDRRHGSVQAAA